MVGSTGRVSRTVLKRGSDFYILASSLASRRTVRVLADSHSFVVFDVDGDIKESPLEALGFFSHDTRYLSRFELRIAGKVPYFLSSRLSDDNAQLRINLSNPDLGAHADNIKLPRNSIEIVRDWVLTEGTLFHQIVVRNYLVSPVELPLDFLFAVDFVDVFEVRGIKRERHGEILKPRFGNDSIRFLYRGLDRVKRFADVVFDTAPAVLDGGRATFPLKLAAGEKKKWRSVSSVDRTTQPLRSIVTRVIQWTSTRLSTADKRRRLILFPLGPDCLQAMSSSMDSLGARAQTSPRSSPAPPRVLT